MKVFVFSALLVLLSHSASAFVPKHNAVMVKRSPVVVASRAHHRRGPAPLKMGLFGPTQEEIEEDERQMANMNEQEKANYMSWKATNAETNAMTNVTLLTMIPFIYFLYIAFTSETMDVDF